MKSSAIVTTASLASSCRRSRRGKAEPTRRATDDRKPGACDPVHRDSVEILLPEDEGDLRTPAGTNEKRLRQQRGVGGEHDVRVELSQTADEHTTVFDILDRTLPERVLAEVRPERESLDLEADGIPRHARDRSLARAVGGGVQVQDIVRAPGELAAELNLEGMPRVVVHQDATHAPAPPARIAWTVSLFPSRPASAFPRRMAVVASGKNPGFERSRAGAFGACR